MYHPKLVVQHLFDQSNFEALPTHTMQCFKLPSSVTQNLDQVNWNFFWKTSTSDNGCPLVAWDKIYKPKKFGGLGLRKTEAVNTTFLAKLTRKFLTQSTNFWVMQMRAKYGSLDEFSTVGRSNPTLGFGNVYFVTGILLPKGCGGDWVMAT